MRTCDTWFAGVLLALLGSLPPATLPLFAAPVAVDAEIVLAVDVSNSVDPAELVIQRSGYVMALRHPDLIRAVRAGVHGRIALTYFEYARRVSPIARVNWHVIDTSQAAGAFADAIAALPVRSDHGTSISRAIGHGLNLIDGDAISGSRRIIDVSGDGPNNLGPPVEMARDAAIAAGVTINGLPILIRPSNAYPEIDRYYETCVIGGNGAFILSARSSEELAFAIRRKLILEISGTGPLKLWRAAGPPPVDCLIGERLRDRVADPIFRKLYE